MTEGVYEFPKREKDLLIQTIDEINDLFDGKFHQ